MSELEVDQSNLPRVQEVCQCFAVREDGALAHNLQEQEIEQYYTSNVQRNQLIQKDICVAKRLQDEEQHRAQMLQHQTTRQLEERDSAYARMIQEEIQHCAEEALRREVEDEEIAKRIQDEEELCARRSGSNENKDVLESSSVPAPPYSPRPVYTLHTDHKYLHQPPSRRWQRSHSPIYSDSEEDLIEHRPTVVTSGSRMYRDCRPSVGQQRKLVSSRRPSRAHLEQDNRSTMSQSSTVSRDSHLSGGWGDVIRLIKNDLSEQGYLSHSSEDELFEPVYKLEKILRQKQQVSDQRRLSRHSSMRENSSRTWQGEGCSHRVSFRDRDQERHVHFLEERRRPNSYHGNGYRANENGHNDTRERDAGILRGNHTHPTLLVGQHQTQSQSFQRNISMRRSYHGDVRLSRRTSVRQGTRTSSHNESDFVNRVRLSNNAPSLESRAGQLMEEEGLGHFRDEDRGRSQRQRSHSLAEEERRIERDRRHYRGEHRVRRSQSERWQIFEEERLSTEEQELERESTREERPCNLSQSCSGSFPREGPAIRSGMAALNLGELEQVLLDEELARRLQEEEDSLAGETPQGASPLRRVCPVGDFRVAQVAQDEEIARFMQKQEVKAKRMSRELDLAEPGQEYRANVNDRRAACERQMQREWQDSEGLQSPVDDFTQDYQIPSPISMAVPQQPIRNVAEELDPTFQRKDTTETGLAIKGPCQNQTSQQVSLLNPMEEPTFVPPTKRQSDKLGRVKTKEKENVKQKENCKQQ
ncbi:trichohyalin-like isoform X2 [Xyrauchen texanus]|uniref:trichohyalin-like isoform X2 n=1 Tax=Xyrauchen texanus TaxID=154827 RepID=UPI002241EAB2|nr:trichohyalin-like isoform X2 [Xyrauchen texanus]